MLNPEKYLNIDLSYTLRKQFAKFRCSSFKLNVALGRHIGTNREDRLDLRNRYLYSWYNGRPSFDIFYRLMSETNPVLIKKIVIYVWHVMDTLT